MPTPTLPEARSPATEAHRPPLRERTHPAVLAVASALLLWFAFPPADRGYLAWVALAPLFLLVRSTRSRAAVYLGAWLGGLVFWLFAVSWVRLTDPSAWLAWVVMATVLSVWWPAFLLLARMGTRTLRLPLMFVAPVAWVSLEYLRAHILSGFPWYYLAHTQYRYVPLIQIADVTGAWGLSALIAMANAWWVDLCELPLFQRTGRRPRLTRPQAIRAVVMALAIFGTSGYGLVRLATAKFRPGPRIALLQSNLLQELKLSLDSNQIIALYQSLAARSLKEKPDLIVWPETSYPRGFAFIDPTLDDSKLDRLAKTIHPDGTSRFWKVDKAQAIQAEIRDWVNRHHVPMLVGTLAFDFRQGEVKRYNSALLFEPETAEVQRYDKIHLVPFGEYVPFIETFPWLIQLTPFQEDSAPSLDFGSKASGFELNGVRYATVICFEDTVPHVARRFFAEAEGARQPDVLLNISNDGWFHGSSEHDMHLAVSVFRTVENRVPLARAVNMGVSALIDGNGTILAQVPKATEGVLVAAAPLDDRESLYTAWGDWLPQTCLAVTIGLVVLALVPGRRRGVGVNRDVPPLDAQTTNGSAPH
ncbi:MAG: apolipoprotein N-acyltransferase [Isosphaeraceae bacterium]